MKVIILKLAFISVIAFLWIGCSDDKSSSADPLVVAHRGVSYSNPENSLQSFDAAITQNIESVECDLYLTNDDSVMIFHDLNVGRLTDLSGNVHDFTASELRNGMQRKTGAIGLTLNEFIDRYKNSFSTIFLEIKEGQSAGKLTSVVQQLEKIVRLHTLEGKIIATCTAHAPLDSLQKYNSLFQVAIEVGEESELPAELKKYKRVLIAYTKLSPAIYQTVKTAGGMLISFTPNTVTEYDQTISNGCDVIMTDNPLELKKFLLSKK